MIRCRGRIDRTTMQHNSMPPIVPNDGQGERAQFGRAFVAHVGRIWPRAAVLRREARRLAADAC